MDLGPDQKRELGKDGCVTFIESAEKWSFQLTRQPGGLQRAVSIDRSSRGGDKILWSAHRWNLPRMRFLVVFLGTLHSASVLGRQPSIPSSITAACSHPP